MPIFEWSTTPGDNASGVTGINWAEGQTPASVNNSARQEMADIAAWRDAFRGIKVTAGTADAQTLTTGLSLAAYADMPLLAFEAGAALTNTTTTTMAVDGLAAKTVKRIGGADLSAGDITAGSIYLLAYEATADVLILLTPKPGAAGGGGTVDTANSPGAGEFARFTDADTIEGLTESEFKAAANLEANTDFYAPGGTDVALADGGTGASTAAGARTNLELVGQQTIWVPAGAMVTRTTAGAPSGTFETTTNDVNVAFKTFDSITSEGVDFAIQMPKGWDEGTIIAQFVWSHGATVTNFGVRWGCRAGAFADGDALDTAWGTAQEVTDTGGTTNDSYISPETAAITVAGSPAAEELVIFEFRRMPADAADTMAIDARLTGVKLHYTINAAIDD